MQKMQEHFSALRCSRLPFLTQFYLPHPWGRTSCIRAVVDTGSPCRYDVLFKQSEGDKVLSVIEG
jgi:hypothetical protein